MFQKIIIEKNKNIQVSLLDFLENEENIEEKYQNLISILEDIKIRDDQHEFRLFLHLLLKISNNHHRGPNFLTKSRKYYVFSKKTLKNFQIEKYSIFSRVTNGLFCFSLKKRSLLLMNFL